MARCNHNFNCPTKTKMAKIVNGKLVILLYLIILITPTLPYICPMAREIVEKI